jgi:heterotetrameric sarcosine oxidase gamma subunit
MGKVLQPQSALQAVLRPGGIGVSGAPGLTIRELRDLSIVQICEIPGVVGGRAKIEGSLGLALPPPCKSVPWSQGWALWSGPGRWLFVEKGHTDSLAKLEGVAAGLIAVTDLSHARSVLRLSGSNIRDVLGKLCAVDLHHRKAFKGDCFVTAVARHSALLQVCDAAPTFDLYVHRSFGQDLFECLTDAAAEYGYEAVS